MLLINIMGHRIVKCYYFEEKERLSIVHFFFLYFFKEQLRKRKDEEERQEILNRSLRGSTKLQALESHTTNLTGQENLAYAQDELTTTVSRPAHVAPQAPLSKSTFSYSLFFVVRKCPVAKNE